MRFGLCCLFKQEKISFRSTTAKSLLAMHRSEQLLKLSDKLMTELKRGGSQ